MVLVQCSVAKRCGCRAAESATAFSWRGSLRRLRCRNRFRSRSSGRAQPSANAKVQRAKCNKQGRAGRDETHASAAPRTGRAAVRLRPGDWTKKPHKKPWGSPPLRTTAAPRQDVSGHDRQLPPHHTPSRKHPPRSRWERRICSATPSPLCPRRAQAPHTLPKPTRTRAPAPPARPPARAGQYVLKLTRPEAPPKTPIRVAR